jgi:hypothetical protein
MCSRLATNSQFECKCLSTSIFGVATHHISNEIVQQYNQTQLCDNIQCNFESLNLCNWRDMSTQTDDNYHRLIIAQRRIGSHIQDAGCFEQISGSIIYR